MRQSRVVITIIWTLSYLGPFQKCNIGVGWWRCTNHNNVPGVRRPRKEYIWDCEMRPETNDMIPFCQHYKLILPSAGEYELWSEVLPPSPPNQNIIRPLAYLVFNSMLTVKRRIIVTLYTILVGFFLTVCTKYIFSFTRASHFSSSHIKHGYFLLGSWYLFDNSLEIWHREYCNVAILDQLLNYSYCNSRGSGSYNVEWRCLA